MWFWFYSPIRHNGLLGYRAPHLLYTSSAQCQCLTFFDEKRISRNIKWLDFVKLCSEDPTADEYVNLKLIFLLSFIHSFFLYRPCHLFWWSDCTCQGINWYDIEHGPIVFKSLAACYFVSLGKCPGTRETAIPPIRERSPNVLWRL